MTPLGQRLRDMRAERGITLKQMADGIGVSSAYLSALEHGRRGRPTSLMIQRIVAFFNVVRDDAEALQQLATQSHPRITIDTAGLDPAATELANLLAEKIDALGPEALRTLKAVILAATRRG